MSSEVTSPALKILSSAQARALHFSQALAWFSDQLANGSSAQSNSGQSRRSQTFALALLDLVERCVLTRSTRSQIVAMAVGKSGGVARLFVDMLASVGISARFVHPTEAFHGDFGLLKSEDTLVVISNGGRSQELVSALESAKELRGCRVYAMTAQPNSPIGKLADQILLLPPVIESCPLEQAPLTSTLTSLALCQLVVGACIESSGIALQEYATNHPGGAIGKRIFVKADDLMLKGDKLPTIGPDAVFADCVASMTRFAAAGLLVLANDKKLLGLVSEKDLRVAMEAFGAKVFEKTVREIMNPDPITLLQGTLATEALRLMENRPRPLNILPVVDGEKKGIGLLRIHDLINSGISAT